MWQQENETLGGWGEHGPCTAEQQHALAGREDVKSQMTMACSLSTVQSIDFEMGLKIMYALATK